MTKMHPSRIAVIGLGEVGEVVAGALLRDGRSDIAVASTNSPRSVAAAKRLGLPLATVPGDAVDGADLVLICAVAASLGPILDAIRDRLKPGALFADFTSATRDQVRAAYGEEHPSGARFIDVAIMGAISMQGAGTPLIAAGAAAEDFAAAMNGFGFNVRAMPNSKVGDASAVKLMRSVFAKGLEALMVESALAAEALGLSEELLSQLDNSDSMPMRDHLAMYLRTHLRHARRRVVEMEAAEQLLVASGLPSLTTRAAIERYRRTLDLIDRGAEALPESDDARSALHWLIRAERERAGKTVSLPAE